jgi:hypothetical protein
MSTTTITIEVDSDAALAFSQASEGDRKKLQLLLDLRLRELTRGSARPLTEIMDDIGQEAESRGLTPEILESILNDD